MKTYKWILILLLIPLDIEGGCSNRVDLKGENMAAKKIRLGEIGVDSGQAMICDPRYITSEWIEEEYKMSPAPKVLHIGTKEEYQLGKDFGHYEWPFRDGKFFHPEDYKKTFDDGEMEEFSLNNLLSAGVFGHISGPFHKSADFSYNGCCKVTLNNPNRGGQLNYKLGHAGAGVVFNTGVGDGCYPVYAYLDDVPGWGVRIVKIEVDFTEHPLL
jgi:hypothetical protein